MLRYPLLLLLLLARAAAPETVTARLEWEPAFLGTNPWRFYPLQGARPDGVIWPAELDRPRYGVLPLGEGRRVHLVVEAGKDGQPLTVDTDLDGDLTDETPRPWKSSGSGLVTKDTVVFQLPGDSAPLPVDLGFFRRGAEAVDEIGVSTRIHRRGVVVLGRRLRPVAIVDGNGDLRFDDPEHDRIYLDEDGDGKLESRERTHEIFLAGRPFRLCGKAYVARVVDPLGGAIEFTTVREAPPPPPRRSFRWTRPEPQRLTDDLRRQWARSLSVLGELPPQGSKECLEFLIRAAGENHSEKVRLGAIRATGYLDYADHAASLGKLVASDAETAVRVEAIKSLHFMDAPGRGRVYAAVLKDAEDAEDDRDKDLVSAAARYLGHMGTDASRKALLRAFARQENLSLRSRIYNGASQANPTGAWTELARLGIEGKGDICTGNALRDLWCLRDPKARSAAVEILERKSMKLGLADVAIRIVSFEARKEGMAQLFDWSVRGKNEVWQMISRSLARTRDPGAIKALLTSGLRHKNARVRGLAVRVLQGIEGKSITEALAKTVRKERTDWLQPWMVQALGDRGGARAIDALMAIARDRRAPARSDAVAALARTGAGDPRVLAFFVKLLESGNADERIYALDVARTAGKSELTGEVIANLGHKEWRVRLAAAEALRGLRVVEAIEPLIVRLGSEGNRRVRDAVGESLFLLTGEDYFDIEDAWRSWWEANRGGFRVPADTPTRRKARGGTVARFYGVPVLSEHVCFVLDRSGSMDAVDAGSAGKQSRLEVAKAEVLGATGRMKESARVNVIFFDTEVRSWKKGLVTLHGSHRAELKKHLKDQRPAGQTNLYDALALALGLKGIDTVFLLSDGAPNAGAYEATGEILSQVRRLNQTRRIAIHSIAIGRDSELLKRLSAENGGRYVRR